MPASQALAIARDARQKRQLAIAQSVLDQLIQAFPRLLEAWQEGFAICHQTGDMEALLKQAKACLAIKPRWVPALVNQAIALRLLQQHGKALESIDKALKQDTADPELHNHKGVTLKEMGQHEQALACFNRCLALNPKHTGAIWNRSDLIGALDDAEYQRLEALADSTSLTSNQKVSLHYALARSDERAKRYSSQFEQIEKGARIKRQSVSYDHDAEIRQIQSVQQVFTEAARSGAQADAVRARFAEFATPIFVCGLPRSGTTLVEQILSSHTDVVAGDELNDLPLAAAEVLKARGITSAFPGWGNQLNDQDWQNIGQRYLERTQGLQQQGFFTDKNLQNYKAIGVIRRALPQAKIVVCRRHPIDNLWGCYRQYFSDGLYFTYDQRELADTWNASDTLIQHWFKQEPDLHLFQYEALVEQPERAIGELLTYLGLEWQDACLNFHQNKRAVRTTSATQVRKPLSNRSVGVWKKYAEQLAPMIERLNVSPEPNKPEPGK